MRLKLKAAFAALCCLLLMMAITTSCGDFFPSSNAIVSITISPTDAGVQLSAGTQQFSAQGTYGNNTSGDVTGKVNWSSSNTSVATIDQAGLATAKAAGTSTITASSSGTTASTTLTVLNVTSITISTGGASTTLSAGGTVQFDAKDQSGNDITNFVSWQSSASDVVTMSSTGLATAASLQTGTSNITAQIAGSGSTTITSNTVTLTVN